MIPIYQTQQIRELERLAENKLHLNGNRLMERAGQAALDFLLQLWPSAKKILIFCGSGNNGGDGYVVAKLAHAKGLQVTIVQLGDHTKMPAEAKAAYEACLKANLSITVFHPNEDLPDTDVIVDAIVGIGLRDTLRETTISAIKKIQQANLPILAIDIPSGIDADTGSVLGAAIPATATITFIGFKLGLLTGSGVSYGGVLTMNDLQLPLELHNQVNPAAKIIQLEDYAHYLKPRAKDWHKGLSGHVLIVGGDHGFSGAPRMAAEAALRVGAGLVTVATQPDNAVEMNLTCPEIICTGIKDANELIPLLKKATVVVLGPGLGQSTWSKRVYQQVINTNLPLVVDADGLNLLSQHALQKENWILTPHPGEASRLIQKSTQDIQQDRLAALKEIQHRYSGVCVLKGAGSLVLSTEGVPGLCDKGNPGMATAGMGDVLSGVIGGLLAQKIPLGDAAKLGVCMHALAGDMAAREGERGLIAMDLMPYLRRLSNI